METPQNISYSSWKVPKKCINNKHSLSFWQNIGYFMYFCDEYSETIHMVNLEQLSLQFVLLLSGICTRAQGISHIETTKSSSTSQVGSWIYNWRKDGNKINTRTKPLGIQ